MKRRVCSSLSFLCRTEILMHRTEHSAPSRSRRQMHQRLKNASQSRPKRAITAVVTAFRFHRPVNQEGPPHDGVTINESPVAAVLTVIAIVTHGEILPWRNDNLVTLNILADLRAPFRNGIERNHLAPYRREIKVEGVVRCGRIMNRIRFIQAFSANEHIPID